MNIQKNNIRQWYALRVTYSQEMKIKEYLDSCALQNFIPMTYTEYYRNGEKKLKKVPAIHNLIFIHCSRNELQELKNNSRISDKIRYIMTKPGNTPMVIPDKQMTDFISVAGSIDEQILFLSPQEITLKKGDRVRITGGIWKGVEGTFVRLKKGLRVVVLLDGLMAVATAGIHPSLVEKID